MTTTMTKIRQPASLPQQPFPALPCAPGSKSLCLPPGELEQEADQDQSFRNKNISISHNLHTPLHSCISVFASMWRMLGERNEQLAVSRRSQQKEKRPFFLQFSCQVHIKLWAHCTLMLVALILKIDLHRHLFGLIYILLFSHKLPEYLRIKICSNTDIH